MKLSELLEKRAAAFARMKAAQGEGGEAFDNAETEVRDLDGQIKRVRSIDDMERREAGTPLHGDRQLDTEIRSRFSLARAVAGAAGLAVDWGFEREVQQELQQRSGRQAKGVLIPTEIFERRVLTSTGDGAAIVPTDHRPELYISALTAASVVRGLGATVLTGLTGNLDIPREAASPAIGWVAENSPLPKGDPDFDSVTLSPKHAGAISEWSRNMVMQSSPQVEQLLRNMLARDLALAIDRAAIKGGGANEPDGILSTDGIQTVAYDGTVFALTNATAEMVAAADIANVDARRSFLATNGVKKMALKMRDGNGLPIPASALFHNEPVTFNNQVPSNLGTGTDEHGLIYGDWSELLIGIWSELDILVNPYEASAYAKGNISIRAMATVDCAVRHPAAFVSATGVEVA
ncbi:phage major capsid protein [Sphingobium limneticum]|uniref:phage major capsid protein n=1 Tax=Sphingobium limneticum TaxID=1007511 RepID=UPI00123D5CE2|nr:phage major capsid protein [Sphingobium limneticum]KAA9014075.1 phage major capsid protein [Sphingobium limneticum]